jgi:hypothetical protein
MNAEWGSDQPEKERASPPESAPVAELTVFANQEELTVRMVEAEKEAVEFERS